MVCKHTSERYLVVFKTVHFHLILAAYCWFRIEYPVLSFLVLFSNPFHRHVCFVVEERVFLEPIPSSFPVCISMLEEK